MGEKILRLSFFEKITTITSKKIDLNILIVHIEKKVIDLAKKIDLHTAHNIEYFKNKVSFFFEKSGQ